ncbi:hypothetical protein Tco_0441942 [Tanacetum coccineum]
MSVENFDKKSFRLCGFGCCRVVATCLAQPGVFSQVTQEVLQVDWSSHIHSLIPLACMTCEDDIQDNDIVKDVSLQLAARIAVSNLHKNTRKLFSETIKDMYNHIVAKRSPIMEIPRPAFQFNVFTGVLPDVTYARNSSATPTGAFSYQPRKRTRGSIFIQKDSGTSGISSSKRPRVCNNGRSQKPSGLPNYPTPAATTFGTPSDTATGHVDSTCRGVLYDATQSFDTALAIKVALLLLPAACHCQTVTCPKKEKKKKALAQVINLQVVAFLAVMNMGLSIKQKYICEKVFDLLKDYMLFDPFINRVADLHDRHRDMRLDVDNMSYELLMKKKKWDFEGEKVVVTFIMLTITWEEIRYGII